MNYSEQELKEQNTAIKKNLAYVFIPIFVMLICIGIYQNYSLDYKSERYIESKKIEFQGKITSKEEEGDFTRAPRFMVLNGTNKIRIPNEIYYQIEIGDSVNKEKGKDSAYYYLKNGKVIIQDCNKVIREEYLKLKIEK